MVITCYQVSSTTKRGIPLLQEGEDVKKYDVFIGDSSATNCGCTPDVKPTDRWTKLVSDADGVQELSVAVSGTGFIVGKKTFQEQLDSVLKTMKDKNIPDTAINRVFIVGGGNDFKANDSEKLTQAYVSTLANVSKAFPKVQKVYMPEVAPISRNDLGGYKGILPYLDFVYGVSRTYGFITPDDWYQVLPFPSDHASAGAGYTHANVKGHNIVAHAVTDWLGSIDGPKTVSDVPEYNGVNADDTVYIRFDANGGWADEYSGAVSLPIDAKANDTVSLPGSDMYKRHGYTFTGWNTKRDGSGINVTVNGLKNWKVPSDSDGSILLFAQWSRNKWNDSTSYKANVTIGDSTAAFVDGSGVNADNRWSRLIANQDNVEDVNTAVNGSGFVTGNDGDTVHGQVDKSVQQLASDGLKPTDVKRVFVVSGANDLKAMLGSDSSNGATFNALQKLIPAVPEALRDITDRYPSSQLVYIPAVVARNTVTDVLHGKTELYSDIIMQIAGKYGYAIDDDWFGLAGDDTGELTVQDRMHLNAKGNANAANALASWLKTIDGPDFKTVNRHKVTYDANDGSDSKATVETDDDGYIVINDPQVTRDGYKFTGWNSKPDGSGTVYKTGDKVRFESDAALYAQWKKSDTGNGGSNNGHHGANDIIGIILGIIRWLSGLFQ